MTIIAYLFLKLQTVKDIVRQMSKKSPFIRPFHKRHGKRSQTLLKSEGQHLYHIHWSLCSQLSCKKSLLVIRKVYRLFVNILTADDKYSLLNNDNLMQRIQIQLSKKQKVFSRFLSTFLKSRINFGHFRKKDDPHSLCISEITDCKERV